MIIVYKSVIALRVELYDRVPMYYYVRALKFFISTGNLYENRRRRSRVGAYKTYILRLRPRLMDQDFIL